MNTNTRLGVDDLNQPLQITSYRTSTFVNIDGTSASAATSAYTETKHIRVQVTSGYVWLTRDTTGTAITLEGMYMPEGSEITMVVYPLDIISVIGGAVNIVKLGV